MPLPSLIEIVPLSGIPSSAITVPGSKSITNRALVLAALADGRTVLRGALWSEDTQVMVESLHRLGFEVAVEPDHDETANRTIIVTGAGGRIPQGGTLESPLELYVGNAGTAARFLAAMVCLGSGVYRLSGVPRMHERPQGALFKALRQLGYQITSPNDRLPVLIQGNPSIVGGFAEVNISESSQFASALILSAAKSRWEILPMGTGDLDDAPYVQMTQRLVEGFPFHGGEFRIEPDASSGSYFWAAGWLAARNLRFPVMPQQSSDLKLPIVVRDWPDSGWQIDARFPSFLPLPNSVSRESDLGDSIMTAIVLAALLHAVPNATSSPLVFRDLGRLRVQECERVLALKTELLKCGARVEEHGDTLQIVPTQLHGAEIETYGDHRMAMCFATLGLYVPGMKIKDPACVRKTFPNFFQKLVIPSPHGLGAAIWECDSGTGIRRRQLFEPSDLLPS